MKILLSYPGYDRLPTVQLSNDVDDVGVEEEEEEEEEGGDIVPYDPLSLHDSNNQYNFTGEVEDGDPQRKGELELGVVALEPAPTSMDHPEFDPLAIWPDDILLDPPDRLAIYINPSQ